MAITCWTQNADLSCQEHGQVAIEQGIATIRGFDWPTQIHEVNEGMLLKKDVCPPGVGFNDGKALFHVFAAGESDWELRVVLEREGRILGIFPKPTKEFMILIHDLDTSCELLRLFFTDKLQLEDRLRLLSS